MTDQQTIERSVLGKRIIAMSWLPFPWLDDTFELQSITLEGGAKLNLDYWIKPDFEKVVIAEIEESEDAGLDSATFLRKHGLAAYMKQHRI